ncbi:hypothetical protein RZS08_14300 [Arthrospira platensis SPKY1]|nr:hypothetical protein [Arthrospira platensis SPKY1]
MRVGPHSQRFRVQRERRCVVAGRAPDLNLAREIDAPPPCETSPCAALMRVARCALSM